MKKKISLISIGVMTFLINFNIVNAGNSFSGNKKTVCGFDYMSDRLPNFTSGLYNIVKLLVPVILIVMGMIDFTKAMMASDEKKMKDAQKSFITRLIASIIIFFIMAIVQFAFKQIGAGSEYRNGFVNCIDCLLNNNNTACGAGTTDLRKSCNDYEGRNCPKVDDYGNACSSYNKAGASYGGCRYKGYECVDYSKNECSSNKNLSGVQCEYVGNQCRESCKGLGMQSCNAKSYCYYVGPYNQGECKQK